LDEWVDVDMDRSPSIPNPVVVYAFAVLLLVVSIPDCGIYIFICLDQLVAVVTWAPANSYRQTSCMDPSLSVNAVKTPLSCSVR